TRAGPKATKVNSFCSSLQNKPKRGPTSTKPSNTACRLLSKNELHTQRGTQRLRDGSQTGALDAIIEKQSSKDKVLDKSLKNCKNLEPRIRPAPSQSGARVTANPSSITRCTKSVRLLDPANNFCKRPDTSEPALMQESRFQTGLDAIIKC